MTGVKYNQVDSASPRQTWFWTSKQAYVTSQLPESITWFARPAPVHGYLLYKLGDETLN